MKPLDSFNPGEEGKVEQIIGTSPSTQRLMALGLLPGANIEVLRIAPFGDPITIRLQHSQLALRKEDAINVLVEPSAGL